MIELKEALQIVLSSARLLATERVDIGQALNRILAEDIISDIDMPPFDKAVFDGYACRRSDLANALTIVETISAGVSPTKTIGFNQCAKIMTGAAVPQGADCVIMVEQTKNVGQHNIVFRGKQTPDNICRKGIDIKIGEVVLKKGARIGPQHIAVAASVGLIQPLVAKKLTVAIVATGDELVEPALMPGPSQIRNSNSLQLAAQLESVGVSVRDYGIVRDVAADIDRVIKTAAADNDVVIVSGGVSVGDSDLVPGILKKNNVKLLFDKIAVQPGKPTAFGLSDKVYFWGLPGNPVSTYVVFELLVKPFLYKLMGCDYSPVSLRMPVDETIVRKNTERQSWIPVNVTKRGTVKPVEYHGSAHILALCNADGLIGIGIGVANIEKGAMVPVILI
jgi:molybdopterin molybdotransferase